MSEPIYRDAPGGKKYRQLYNVEDVTPEVLVVVDSVVDSWFPDSEAPIDWEEFLERLEKWLPDEWEISELDNPAIRKIKRHVRQYRSN